MRPPATELEMDPLLGKVLADRFEITELIARGGMGRIYKAVQARLGRTVAIKVLDPARHVSGDPTYRRRFEREAAICAKLNHSNTVRIFDYGVDQGLYYIAMEYIRGRTLLEVINAEAPLAPGRVVHIAKQVCGSLREAHDRGIVHRDLKPGNILLTRQGDDQDFVKVVDFGLVKEILGNDSDEVTADGKIVGSPMCMSPEQIRGETIDLRTDVYALGVILYFALTGRKPFDPGTTGSVAVLMGHISQPPKPLVEANEEVRVPPSFEWVVLTCMKKSRYERFASFAEVDRALNAVAAELAGKGPYTLSLDDSGHTVLPPDFTEEQTISKTHFVPQDLVDEEPRRPPWILLVLAAIVILLAVSLGGIGLLGSGGGGSDEDAEQVPAHATIPAPVLLDPDVDQPEPASEADPENEPASEPGVDDPISPETSPTTIEPAAPVAPSPAPGPEAARRPRAPTIPPPAPSSSDESPPNMTESKDEPASEDSQWKVRSDIRNPFESPRPSSGSSSEE